MKPLTIELVKGQRCEWQSVGWKSPKTGDCRRRFYALTNTGSPVVITLKPAVPSFYVPGGSVVVRGEPFPEAVCVEISTCRLLPPLCYRSRQEHDSQLSGYALFEPWKLEYLKTGGVLLALSPEDDGPLQERLQQWLCAMRVLLDQAKVTLLHEFEQLTNSSLADLKLASEAERQQKASEAREHLAGLESDNRPTGNRGPVPSAGWLKLTLEDVKRGAAGIRDHWMHEQWAKANGADLAAMARERFAIRRWLTEHTGTPTLVYDAVAQERRHEIAPPAFGEDFEHNPQFLEACAKVRFRAKFADSAGTMVYSAEVELREELDAVELEEVRRLRQGPSRGEAEAKAELQRTLSQGLMLTVGPLVENMSGAERLLFNFLMSGNPHRPGWALSYREIGHRLGVSPSEIQRRREKLERKAGREIARLIAEARSRNEKGINPDLCGGGHEVKTEDPDSDDN